MMFNGVVWEHILIFACPIEQEQREKENNWFTEDNGEKQADQIKSHATEYSTQNKK